MSHLNFGAPTKNNKNMFGLSVRFVNFVSGGSNFFPIKKFLYADFKLVLWEGFVYILF
jgi:hypothetical protein